MDIINKTSKKILNRASVALAGLIFIIVLIIFSESLGLPTELYINWIENDSVILILLFGTLSILILWLLGIHLNYRYNKYLKSLSPKERKREEENYRIADEIIKYICNKYGNNYDLELINVIDKEDKYIMIYKKPKKPQKIKISFDKKNKTIEESYI